MGLQVYSADGAPIFRAGGLQGQLEALSTANPALAFYSGSHDFGFAGGAQAEGEYHITPAFSVGGRVGIQRAGNFTEGGALAFARYSLGGI